MDDPYASSGTCDKTSHVPTHQSTDVMGDILPQQLPSLPAPNPELKVPIPDFLQAGKYNIYN